MRRLATGVQCQFVALVIVNSDRNARLHWVGHDPVVDKRKAHDMPRRRHRGIDGVGVADLEDARNVAGSLGPKRRCAALRGLAQAGQGWLRRERDLHRFGRILGLIDSFGHDDCDGVTHITSAFPRQRIARRCGEVSSIRAANDRCGAHRAKAVASEIFGGEDAGNARHAARARDIDRTKLGVGVRRADHHHFELPGKGSIPEKLSTAGKQPRIFYSERRQPRAETGRGFLRACVWLRPRHRVELCFGGSGRREAGSAQKRYSAAG